jgi:hypothetical protein
MVTVATLAFIVVQVIGSVLAVIPGSHVGVAVEVVVPPVVRVKGPAALSATLEHPEDVRVMLLLLMVPLWAVITAVPLAVAETTPPDETTIAPTGVLAAVHVVAGTGTSRSVPL